MSLKQHNIIDSQIESLRALKITLNRQKDIDEGINTSALINATLEAMKIFDAHNTCLTVEQCAEFLKVHRNTITSRIHSGEIQANFIGRVWRIPKLQFVEEILKHS